MKIHEIDKNWFLKIKALKKLYAFMAKKGIDIYLVGGSIRDIMLSKFTRDLDFVLKGNVIALTKKFAGIVKGHFVLLDDENITARVLLKENNEEWQFDFTQMPTKNINNDLKRRDFTINAMAFDLEQVYSGKPILISDPFNGIKDLKESRIRAITEKAFIDDPLRLLRAFRFSSSLGFGIEPKTIRFIKKHAAKLSKVSAERIRDEFFLVLSGPRSAKFISEMAAKKLLVSVLPGINVLIKNKDLWKHSLSTLDAIESIAAGKTNLNVKKTQIDQMVTHLNNTVCEKRTRLGLLKLACFLHDIGKPSTRKFKNGKLSFIGHENVGAGLIKKIGLYLKLSKKEIRILEGIVFLHMRVHYLANLESISERAVSKLLRDCKEELAEILFFSFADFIATPVSIRKLGIKKYHKAAKIIADRYFKNLNIQKKPRLINGHDLIKKFGMKEGPQIGKILEEVELARSEGKIKARQEALGFVARMLKKSTR